MHEFESFARNGPLERAGHSFEKRMRQQIRANQVFQVGIVIADHINRIHRGKPVNQGHLMHENPADIGLPELKQIAQHKEFAAAVFHILQKKIEFAGFIVSGKIVPRAAVADMQVAYNKNVFGVRQ
jgi:hypothetical protein